MDPKMNRSTCLVLWADQDYWEGTFYQFYSGFAPGNCAFSLSWDWQCQRPSDPRPTPSHQTWKKCSLHPKPRPPAAQWAQWLFSCTYSFPDIPFFLVSGIVNMGVKHSKATNMESWAKLEVLLLLLLLLLAEEIPVLTLCWQEQHVAVF